MFTHVITNRSHRQARPLFTVIVTGSLAIALTTSASAAGPQKGKAHAISNVATAATPAAPTTVNEAANDPQQSIDVLTGLRSGQLSVKAEGASDGSITMSLSNKTHAKLRVVLPPGLIVSGATGQFGGGMGGMGGGMGGMGGGMMGGMGGMGGGMMGGMGGMGGGMGGMGGGMGGMGGGMGGMRGGMGGGTMPASMGMMMLGRLIMNLVGDRDSWNQRSLMLGMMMGGGMGGGMGGMGGGMGGMGGGMGGMMGGGFRSVPPTGLPFTDLDPRQVRHLPLNVVSLNPPRDSGLPAVPATGEQFQILAIDQATDDARTQQALKRLAEAKAPQTVAQMVLWYVTAGANWDDIGRLSQGWGNAYEIALARQFVATLDQSEGKSTKANADSGVLYWEIKAEGDQASKLAASLRELWAKHSVLGLTATEGIPTTPKAPSLACRMEISAHGVEVKLAASHPSGSEWIPVGTFKIKATDEMLASAPKLGDAIAEQSLERLVRIQLSHGPREKGKESFRVKIINASPMMLNGLVLGGPKPIDDTPPAVLVGLSIPPLKSLTIGASADLVKRLHLKEGTRVLATDLSGL